MLQNALIEEKMSFKVNKFLATGLAVLCIGGLFALGQNLKEFNYKQAKEHANNKKRKVVVAQFGDVFLYAPIYLAKDAGFFAKRNLDVSFVSTGGDEKTWAAVVSGNADVGVADPTFVAISANQGLSGIVIASIVSKAPFWGITLQQNLVPFTDPVKLKDLSVATFPSPSTAYTLQKSMFLSAGLEPNIKQGAFGTLLTILKAKQADIALEIEPNVSSSLLSGAKILYGMDKVYGEFQTTGLTVLPNTIQKDEEMLVGLVCSIADAMTYIRTNPESAVSLMSKRFPEVNESVAAKAMKRMANSLVIPETPVISKEAWDNAIRLRKVVGDIKGGGEYEKFVDNKIASKCKQ